MRIGVSACLIGVALAVASESVAAPSKRALDHDVFDAPIAASNHKRVLDSDGDVFPTARRALDVDVFDTPIKVTKTRRKLDTDVFDRRRAIDTDVFDEQRAPSRRPLDSDVFR